MNIDNFERQYSIGPIQIGIANAFLSVMGLLWIPDLVFGATTFFLCGFLVVTALALFKKMNDEEFREYQYFAIPVLFPALICCAGYLLITDSQQLELEFDGSPKRYEAYLRSYLMPERFYRGQHMIIDATIAKIKSDHVPGWKYAAGIEAEEKERAAFVAGLLDASRKPIEAKSYPATPPSDAETQARGLVEEANQLKEVAKQIRFKEYVKQIALTHDQEYQEKLARYDSLRRRVLERINRL